MNKFLVILTNEDYTEVKLVEPSEETDDNDTALELEVSPDFQFTSVIEAFAFIKAKRINLTGEFIGVIY